MGALALTTEMPMLTADGSLPAAQDGSGARTWTWMIAPNPRATHVVYTMTCLSCGEGDSDDEDCVPTQNWALRHASSTGHRQFAADIRTFWDAFQLDAGQTNEATT